MRALPHVLTISADIEQNIAMTGRLIQLVAHPTLALSNRKTHAEALYRPPTITIDRSSFEAQTRYTIRLHKYVSGTGSHRTWDAYLDGYLEPKIVGRPTSHDESIGEQIRAARPRLLDDLRRKKTSDAIIARIASDLDRIASAFDRAVEARVNRPTLSRHLRTAMDGLSAHR
jgi:hypothetical protein